MFGLTELTLLSLLVLGAALFWRGQGLRQRAWQAARRHCQQAGVQILDDTVQLHRSRLVRGPDQRLTLQRTFQFEFTVQGDRRYRGQLRITAGRLGPVQLEAFSAPTPDQSSVVSSPQACQVIPFPRDPGLDDRDA